MLKKILIILLFLTGYGYSQFKDINSPYRVVVVSPNFQNVYPRFSTLQNAFNSIVDSADAGKYFVINLTTNYNNITDYSSKWKDSIVSRLPYMSLAYFGQAIGDSIIGVTTSEFSLIMGILSLNSATAGYGLFFSDHAYHVLLSQIGALQLDGDTLGFLYYNYDFSVDPLQYGLMLKHPTNAGWFRTADGLQIRHRLPLGLINDTTVLYYAPPLYADDSLRFGYDPDAFTVLYGVLPNFFFRADSGLTVPIGGNGVKVSVDMTRILFDADKKVTISDLTAGSGLKWLGDSLNVLTVKPLWQTGDGDSIYLKYATQHFDVVLPDGELEIKLDSGMTTGSSGIMPYIDYTTLIFNSLYQLVVNPSIAGVGLAMTSGVIDINYNDFLVVQNDTLKAKTSTILWFRFDSLNSSIKYDVNADTVGLGVSASGKTKRISISYKTDAGNDTTIIIETSISFNKGNRLSCSLNPLGTSLYLEKNNVPVATLNLYDLTTPYLRRVNVGVEIYLEAL